MARACNSNRTGRPLLQRLQGTAAADAAADIHRSRRARAAGFVLLGRHHMNAAIFIDGGYFDRVSRDCGSPRIDFGKLSQELARPHELLRTYYYHCLPYMGPTPSEEDQQRYENKQRFFNALTRLNRFEVREGKLEYRGTDRESERPIFEQKRVDIYLGVDLVMLAAKQRIHRAILVTGDSDFLPAIRAAKNEGVLVHLFHGTGPQQPHKDLWDEVDERTVITPDLLQHFLL